MKYGIIVGLAALLVAGCDRIPGTKAHQIRTMEEKVSADFFDPEAVNYRNIEIKSIWVPDQPKPIPAFCGEVNGKNREGAYVGFKRFVYTDIKAGFAADPQVEATEEDLEKEKALCPGKDAPRTTNYAQALEDLEHCKRVADLYRERTPQYQFDDVWKLVCVDPISKTRPQHQIDAAKEARTGESVTR